MAVGLALLGLLTQGAPDFSGMMLLLAVAAAGVGLLLIGTGLLGGAPTKE